MAKQKPTGGDGVRGYVPPGERGASRASGGTGVRGYVPPGQRKPKPRRPRGPQPGSIPALNRGTALGPMTRDPQQVVRVDPAPGARGYVNVTRADGSRQRVSVGALRLIGASGSAGRPDVAGTAPAILSTALQQAPPTPTSGFFGVINNAAREASGMVTGLPQAAWLGLRMLAAPVTIPAGIAGAGWADRFNVDTGNDIATGLRGAVNDYRDRYGRLISGDFGVLGERPLSFAMDAAGGYSAATRGLGSLARLSTPARLGGRPVFGVRAANWGSRAFAEENALRYRQRETPNPYGGNPIVEVTRPRSANPVTRSIQRRVTDPIIGRVRRAYVEHRPEAAYQSAARRRAMDIRYSGEEAGRALANEKIAGMVESVRDLRGSRLRGTRKGRVGRERAVWAHVRGLTSMDHMPAAEAWKREITRREEIVNSLAADGRRPRDLARARTNLDEIRQIDPADLDWNTASPEVKTAVVEQLRGLGWSTGKMVNMGLITSKTARLSRTRFADVTAGGARHSDRIVRETPAVVAARAAAGVARNEYEAARARLAAVPKPTLKSAFSAGRRSGSAEVRLETAPGISKNRRLQPQIASPSDVVRPLGVDQPRVVRVQYQPAHTSVRKAPPKETRYIVKVGDREIGVRGGYKTAEQAQIAAERFARSSHQVQHQTPLGGDARRGGTGERRPVGISPTQGRHFHSDLRARGRLYQLSQREVQRARLTAERNAARTRFRDANARRRAVEDRNRGAFTEPMATGYTRPKTAAYFPDVVRDARRQDPIQVKGGMTAPAVQKNTGRVLMEGVDDPRLERGIESVRKVAMAAKKGEGVAKLFDELGVRYDNTHVKHGELMTGEDARLFAEQHPDTHVAVTQNTLIRGIESAANQGDPIAASLMADLEGTARGEVIAIPKAAYDEFMAGSGGMFKRWDDIMGVWKAGSLTTLPRWVVQNVIGNWAQFVVGAGADLQAVRMGRKKNIVKGQFSNRFQESGIAGEMSGRAAQERISVPVLRKAKGYANWVYRWNNAWEQLPRRAMEIHATKKMLRMETGKTRWSRQELQSAMVDLQKALGDPNNQAHKQAVALSQHIVREAERFLGNYARFNRVERGLRRVMPFYAWARTIYRLAFSLPFKHPLRTLALATASRMGAAAYGKNDWLFESYQRGSVPFLGFRLPTNAMNPAASVLPGIEGVGGSQSTGDLLTNAAMMGADWMGPVFSTMIPAYLSGRNSLGIPYSVEPGYNGSYVDRNGTTMRPDVYGRPREYQFVPDPVDMVLRSFPITNFVREAVGGGPQYDTSSTWDILMGNGQRRPDPKSGRSVSRIPFIGPATGAILGSPISKYDVNIARRKWEQQQRDMRSGRRYTARRAARLP